MTLQEFVKEFESVVNSGHIEVGWDAGHCYSYITHPLMDKLGELSEEDQDEFNGVFLSEWMGDHEPTLYCVPELCNALGFDSSKPYNSETNHGCVSCECECADRKRIEDDYGDNYADYIEGFINLVKRQAKHFDEVRQLEWYYIDLLEAWLKDERALEQFHSQFEVSHG
jgi:hypothetical protein